LLKRRWRKIFAIFSELKEKDMVVRFLLHHLDETVEHELSVVSTDQGQEHLLPEDSAQCELFAFGLRKSFKISTRKEDYEGSV
jgi:hypothetical protein